jgi:xanthosine utilization system XapX-like protein
MKKYYLYWSIGIFVSIIGVILTKKMPANSFWSFAGYIFAFLGISIIAFAINKKSKKDNI